MANEDYPLLLFPPSVSVKERDLRHGGTGKRVLLPSAGRQGERLNPRFDAVRTAIEAKRVTVAGNAPTQEPEFVLVLETVGSHDDFYKAVGRLQADWLFEAEEQFVQDDDFRLEEEWVDGQAPSLKGRAYLVGTSQRALDQILSFWHRYQDDPSGKFDFGLAPLKHVFEHLHDVRRWDVQDRIDSDMREYWQDEVQSGQSVSRFEIEAWYYDAEEKNASVTNELAQFVNDAGGRVLQSALIPEIAYHGILVELPVTKVQEILDGQLPSITLSDRVMFFRPRTQSIATTTNDFSSSTAFDDSRASERDPIVALLDGLPLANHAALQNRLIIDDPDGWESSYAVKDRVHGTAMASLILHGDLNAPSGASVHRLYVRPIMRPMFKIPAVDDRSKLLATCFCSTSSIAPSGGCMSRRREASHRPPRSG